MTRRKFIEKFLKSGSAIVIGGFLRLWRPTKQAVKRKFIWAVRLKKYPGSLGPLWDVNKQGKWSG